MDKIAYVYIKGDTYKEYTLKYQGDETFNEIEKTFETLEELMQYVITFSDYYSISIQFYR